MLVTLQVTSPHGAKQQIQLYSGQVAQFGRTDWADFSFPNDPQMADLHFSLDCSRGRCQMKNLDAAHATRLNGQPVKEALLRHGDRIVAGRTQFELLMEDEGAAAESAKQEEVAEAPAAAVVPQASPIEVCEYLDLEDEVKEIARSLQTTDELIVRLVEKEIFPAAIRLQAHLLPKTDAVWWGCRCVEEVYHDALPPPDLEALQAARAWSLDNTEINRRKAEEAANRTKLGTGAAWVAMAAFWSEGSLSEPNLPVVEPDEKLTGQALTGAMLITASFSDPGAAPQRYRNFLAAARQIARGELKPAAG
jgi:hypothetical protein